MEFMPPSNRSNECDMKEAEPKISDVDGPARATTRPSTLTSDRSDIRHRNIHMMSDRRTSRSSAFSDAARPQFISFANTSELLIHSSKRVVEIVNSRDYSDPFLNCLATNLAGTNGCTTGKEQVLDDFRAMVQRYPNYRAEVHNVTCSIGDNTGQATVVLPNRISGYAFDTVRQTAALFIWTRSEDRWTCARWELVKRIEEFD